MININKTFELSDSDNTDIFRRTTKVGEEYGEFCAAILEEDGFKVSKKNLTPTQLREHILEEGCDTIQVILDVLRVKGFTEEEISTMYNSKLEAWDNVLKQKGKRQ